MIKLAKILIGAGAAIVVFFIISSFQWERYILSDLSIFINALICLLFYLTGYLLLFLKRGSVGLRKITKSVAIQSAIYFLFGINGKAMRLPYGGLLLIISVFLMIFIYVPIDFKLKIEKWKVYTRSKRDAFILCLVDIMGIAIVLFAILFKFQHWPGSSIMIIAGVLLTAISIFAWNQKFKKEIIFRKHAEDKLNESLKEVIEQKQLIEEKGNILKQQNEEIRTINETLNEQQRLIKDKNVELEAQNEEISAQRDMLSKSNKAISESILYAKRIQTAVLPQQAYIDEILMDNFILYKPRNVVSGDFYWLRQINHFIIIAAADCTGHGVPGAIMSMLGISFLNEIVQKREITRANVILNEMRKQLKHSLKQTGREGGIDDGMDMALCVLDSKTNHLQFAGANNPLYYIQNNELIEIQADIMPIGFYPNEKPTFTNHEIELKEGDCFYLFSDGFIDQFGGEKGMKLKAPNFQKILLENHSKPLQIQKELLEQELHSWMKGYEQTDDILVMGVRI